MIQKTHPEEGAGPAQVSELVTSMRAGDDAATEQLRRLLYPGVRFLMRRRLGHCYVDAEAESVIAEALAAMQADASLAGGWLLKIVLARIQQRYELLQKQSRSREETCNAGRQAAQCILQRMSPLEREALRRRYVLGEAPESLAARLNLSTEQFRAIQHGARAVFHSGRPLKTNVA